MILDIMKVLTIFVFFATRLVLATDRPNVVFAIADDWGWPHASAYGDTGIKTRTFDRLVKEGVLFENAYISSPSCTPSRGAIITGQQFWRLRQAGNLWSVWPSGFPEYPKILASHGYFVGSYRKGWGPGRHPYSATNPAGKRYSTVDEFFEARPTNSPFCFWFGTGDPHRPYAPGNGIHSGIDPSEVHLFEHYPDVKEIRSDIANYYWEIERFDREVGTLIRRLEEMGELDNTIIVMTSDNGMPFPRAKANLYDAGTRVPLVIRWPVRIPPGRRVTDFVSATDLAPTFLEAAGLHALKDMTGQSLLALLTSNGSGRIETERNHIFFGKERHVPAQEAPDSGGYPMRGIRTDEYLYIRNFEPGRWPAGTPNYSMAFIKNGWLADCDNGPTKWYLWFHRNDPAVKRYYDLAFGTRPAEELYDLKKDPVQINNVAGNKEYRSIQKDLAIRLSENLDATGDPRVHGRGKFFDLQPYLGQGPTYPNQ
jgi:N-sulfoglucosamine sulfohydrolase